MLFNSYLFIFLFLPLCVGGYFLLNHLGRPRLALAFLFGMSLWFYAYFNFSYLAIIVCSILINFGFYTLSKHVKRPPLRRLLKTLAVLVNLGIFFYYKYFDFFLENVNALFGTDFVLRNILLPLGISFFTFQQLSFVIDAFNGEVPDYDFLCYACFVTFFPQLVAGPIVTHDELVPQLMDENRKRFDWESCAAGLYLFAIGLAKKVLLADTLGMVADYCFAAVGDYRFEQITTAGAWVAALSFTLQLYLDFSGYSDMAIGIGKMFNVKLPRNFDSPYRALTIVEHWKRWHLTLTRFFTRYVYIPLGGSRRGSLRTYVNILCVFFLSGLWHGAAWTYVLWGTLHGVANCLCRLTDKLWKRLPAVFSWAITFLLVTALDTIFRADSLSDALFLMARMFRYTPGGVHPEILASLSQPELSLLAGGLPFLPPDSAKLAVLLAFLAFCLLLVLLPRNSNALLADFHPSVGRSVAAAALLLLCIFSFAGVSTFLYFNF